MGIILKYKAVWFLDSEKKFSESRTKRNNYGRIDSYKIVQFMFSTIWFKV
jgi:hypothetical protein